MQLSSKHKTFQEQQKSIYNNFITLKTSRLEHSLKTIQSPKAISGFDRTRNSITQSLKLTKSKIKNPNLDKVNFKVVAVVTDETDQVDESRDEPSLNNIIESEVEYDVDSSNSSPIVHKVPSLKGFSSDLECPLYEDYNGGQFIANYTAYATLGDLSTKSPSPSTRHR